MLTTEPTPESSLRLKELETLVETGLACSTEPDQWTHIAARDIACWEIPRNPVNLQFEAVLSGLRIGRGQGSERRKFKESLSDFIQLSISLESLHIPEDRATITCAEMKTKLLSGNSDQAHLPNVMITATFQGGGSRRHRPESSSHPTLLGNLTLNK